jgi:hypothetical protein
MIKVGSKVRININEAPNNGRYGIVCMTDRKCNVNYGKNI